MESYPLARISLAELLQHDGYRVFQAADREAAISCIDKNLDLAVVLSDLDMPHWKSLLRHARTFVPKALILGMVGFRSVPEPAELEHRGIYQCLRKPLMFENVHQAIVNHTAGDSKR